MLGSDLELTADVVSDELLEERIVAVGKQIVNLMPERTNTFFTLGSASIASRSFMYSV